MPDKGKEMTLLQSLLDCFSASKTMIKYVIERERNGHIEYELPLNDIKAWWQLLFSRDLVALSVAPRSHDKQLSKDALSAFVRHTVNDKNKSIVEKNLIPHLKGARCAGLISDEVSHLEHTIDLGVRAANSPWGKYSDSILSAKMKESADIQVYYEDAVRFLMQLFFEVPYKILKTDYSWFADCVDVSKDSAEKYTTTQIITVFACALILCLNVQDDPSINKNIESYISSALESPQQQRIPEERDTVAKRKPIPPAEINELVDLARHKISVYEVRELRTPLHDEDVQIIYIIIELILADYYKDILHISAGQWLNSSNELRAHDILSAYIHEWKAFLYEDYRAAFSAQMHKSESSVSSEKLYETRCSLERAMNSREKHCKITARKDANFIKNKAPQFEMGTKLDAMAVQLKKEISELKGKLHYSNLKKELASAFGPDVFNGVDQMIRENPEFKDFVYEYLLPFYDALAQDDEERVYEIQTIEGYEYLVWETLTIEGQTYSYLVSTEDAFDHAILKNEVDEDGTEYYTFPESEEEHELVFKSFALDYLMKMKRYLEKAERKKQTIEDENQKNGDYLLDR